MNKMSEIQKEGFKQEIFYGFMGVLKHSNKQPLMIILYSFIHLFLTFKVCSDYFSKE
jgi:hypothetical protein